jgi:hypothetical protein
MPMNSHQAFEIKKTLLFQCIAIFSENRFMGCVCNAGSWRYQSLDAPCNWRYRKLEIP